MKKRVLAGLMMAAMVLASAMSVSAASKEKPVEEVGSQKGVYEVIIPPTFGNNVSDDTKEKIEKLNKDESVSISTEVDKAIKGKKIVQTFFGLEAVGTHQECDDRNYHAVTLKVDAMTTTWKNITIVYYSAEGTVWKTISGDKIKVDYDKKTLAFNIEEDMSLVAIYADKVEEGPTGTSPSTEGVSSAWMLYSAMALIVLGTGVVVYQKKRG